MANSEIIGAGQDTAHRAPKINTITCGECLDVMHVMPDNYVDVVLTDLPYGINEHGGKYRFGPQSMKKGFKTNKHYDNLGWDSQRFNGEFFK